MQGSDGTGKTGAARAGQEGEAAGRRATVGSPAMKSSRPASLADRQRRKEVAAHGLG
jgi:hypothetical protein